MRALPLLLAAPLLVVGCSRDEEPVANRFGRTEAAIENKARAYEAQVEKEVGEVEARLENEADAYLNAARDEAAESNSAVNAVR